MEVEEIALRIAETLREALATRHLVTAAVSSGPAVLGVLTALSTLDVAWPRVRFLMVDEIAAPPTDPRTTYRQVYDAFFSRIGFLPGRALRYWSEGTVPDEVASYYGVMAAELLDLPPGEIPRLDAVLLELAPDGAVGAFLPGSAALEPGGGFARSLDVGGEIRYTLTGDVVRRARRVFLLGRGGFDGSDVVPRLRPDDGELVCLRVGETGPGRTASQP